ncbi:hypothetical protein [Streptosporangium sp. NPDC004631]
MGDESLRDWLNDSLDVMSICDNERLGAESAIEIRGPRHRPTGVPGRPVTTAGGFGLVERTACGERMAVTT